MSVEEILSEIEKRTNIPRNELEEKVKKRHEELFGLVNEEGAAHLVARELGVDLLEYNKRRLQIKNIVAGAKNINIIGRVFRISPINEFTRQNGSKGRVVNLFIGDNTGYVRMPLWNDQVKLIEDEMIKLGDIVRITNGFSRENIFGDVEVDLGKYGSIRTIEDSLDIVSANELNKKFFSLEPERTIIKDITTGNFEIKATIVDVFKGKFIFDVCSICSGTVKGSGERYICEEHGEVEPKCALVVSCIVDDGSGDIRAVFFRDLAERVCGINAEELKNLGAEERYKILSKKLLGKELILSGIVKNNRMFDRLEMMVVNFKDLNVQEESKNLLEKIELMVGA
jgi:replication factor A1